MNNKKKNILVTGASGALGMAVIDLLKQSDKYNIFATSRNATKDGSDIICDVRDQKQIINAIEISAPDIILHLAASFANDFYEAYAVNVESTRHLLDHIKLCAMHTKVLLIGSAAEYGMVTSDENPIDETRHLAPVSIYGLSKAWQTQLMGLYAGTVDVLCARVFNLYGAGLSDKLFAGRLLKQITEVIAGNAKYIQFGQLSAIRDYISTADAAEQLLTIITRGSSGKVYHVASGVPITMRDFAIEQLRANGLDSSILQESESYSNHIGYDVPVIFANNHETTRLMKPTYA